jgi:RimJ/RimL family protein N-acetyltransferase
MPAIDESLIGSVITLKLAEESDAAFIWMLRNDPRYNTHLSTTSGTVEDQKAWLRRYKEREAAGSEYYFCIFRNDDGRPCGTVRVYDVRDGQFTWGSWILNEDKPAKAALDTAIQIYRFGFDVLGLAKSVYDVRRENTHTLDFHDRFGGLRTGEDAENIYYELPRQRFFDLAPSYAKAFAAQG